MKTNERLIKDVEKAIKWEPFLSDAEITVTATNAIIELSGIVDVYAKKNMAIITAKNVMGVTGVTDCIKIISLQKAIKSDLDIEKEILTVFASNWEISKLEIAIQVINGWVTLEGDLPWNFQKESAERAVISLAGITGISNNIRIVSEKRDTIERLDIQSAIGRNWSMIDNDIVVEVTDNRVTLTGHVNSLYQKDEAGRITWNTPGISSLDNQLCVNCK